MIIGVPPTPAASYPHAPDVPPASTPPAAKYEHEAGFSFAPKVIDWIPAGCLALIFVLVWAGWLGTFPGGVRVYTQSPMQASVGWFTTHSLPEAVLADEKYLSDHVSMNWLMLLYFPILVLATAVAWVERFVKPHQIPPAMKQFWQSWDTILLGATVALLLLIVVQSWRGFGLETAVRQKAAENAAAKLEPLDAQPDSTPKRQRTAVVNGEELGRFSLESTTACDLALLAHVVALAGLGLRFWLHRRGTKPLPRVALHW
ncbi:hypothetical protein FRUB_03951 [Fimbriiglobus ruber]|uniref:Uncharacterized protein n=1 Tax=Fimbriiglobus ruber TaxID=1908690 RepID=A0A225DLL5_9BACT|nr:hypothetical protein FRUB_03951 [Fimbriiglobus ruber]